MDIVFSIRIQVFSGFLANIIRKSGTATVLITSKTMVVIAILATAATSTPLLLLLLLLLLRRRQRLLLPRLLLQPAYFILPLLQFLLLISQIDDIVIGVLFSTDGSQGRICTQMVASIKEFSREIHL